MTTTDEVTSASADPRFMDALLDCLLPASPDGRMPAAGSLGLGAVVTNGISGQAQVGTMITAALQRLQASARAEDGFH